MNSKPKLLILSTTFERSVPHHNSPLQKQRFTQLKHTELIYETFLVLNCKICTFREHKLSLKTSPKNLRLLWSPLHSTLSQKMSSAAKQLIPNTRRSRKKTGNRWNSLYYSSDIFLALFFLPLAIFKTTTTLLLSHCLRILSSSAPVGFSCKLLFPFPIRPFLLKPIPSVLMKMRRHSYTHQEQKLHACPCRIKECRKPKTAVT
jgi:hypothetical protein